MIQSPRNDPNSWKGANAVCQTARRSEVRRTAGSTMNSEVNHFPMPNVQNPPFAKFCKFAQSINKSNLTLHQFVAACARNNQNNSPKLDQTHPMWKTCSLRQTQRVNSMRLQNGRCRTPAARARSLCERHVQPTHTAPLLPCVCVAALTARSVRHTRLLLASLCARVAQTLPPL